MGIFRDATIKWPTPGLGNTLNLNVPVQKVKPGRGGTVMTRVSEDGTRVQKVRVGAGVYDVVVELRYQDMSTTLMDWLVAAIEENKESQYDPDDGSGTHDFLVMEPKTIDQIDFDDLQKTEDWHRIVMRWRKTDGTRWTGIF